MKNLEDELKTLRESENRIPLKLEEIESIAERVLDSDSARPVRKSSVLSRLLPECYTTFTPPTSLKVSNFHEETLFYIFYGFPESDYQLKAYNELLQRGYVFSKTLNLFLFFNEPKAIDNRRRNILAFSPKDWEKINVEVTFDTSFISNLVSSPYN